jgi:hypothetical protein
VRLKRIGALVGLGLAVSTAATSQPSGGMDVSAVLVRVGERVAEYFARAQSLVCRETVSIQTLNTSFTGDGSLARHLVYDLRIEWQPAANPDEAPVANVLREIVSVGGRRARPNDEPKCMDPKPVTPDPLAMLLPNKQSDFTFNWGGFAKVDGKPAVMIDYRSRESGKPVVTKKDEDCYEFDAPGRTRGRVWIDQSSGDVLRLDEALTGMVDFDYTDRSRSRMFSSWTIERADTSIRYRQLTFQAPEETLTVPISIDRMTVIRNSIGLTLTPRVRISQRFSDYRRFVTEGRIVQ